MRQAAYDYIKKKYKVSPEFPWRKYDGNAMFRHADNNKWFALIMDVQGEPLSESQFMRVWNYIKVLNTKPKANTKSKKGPEL